MHNFPALKRWCERDDLDDIKRYILTTDRLDMAERRENSVDKVLDLAIALESLFDGDQELSYRYATNCAALLE